MELPLTLRDKGFVARLGYKHAFQGWIREYMFILPLELYNSNG